MGGGDLPMPKAGPPPVPFGAPPARSGLDLPVPKAGPTGGGGVDLPVPKAGGAGAFGSGAGFGAAAAAGMDLPVPRAGSGVDLPVPKAGSGVDLPVPKAGSGVDLPVPKAGGVDLPVPRSTGFQGGVGLPVPKADPGYGGTGHGGAALPVPKAATDWSQLPMPKAEGLAGSVGLPVPKGPGGVDLPTPAGTGSPDSVLPVPVDAMADVPTPAGGAYGELPVPAEDQWGHLPVPSGAFSGEGYELDDDLGAPLELSDSPGGPGVAPPAFAPAPPIVDRPPKSQPRGMVEAGPVHLPPPPGIELDVPGGAAPSSAPAAAPSKAAAGAKKKKPGAKGGGKGAVVALAIILMMIVGGGVALGFTPFGFFGMGLLTGRAGANSDDNLASDVIVQARQKVALDTYRDHRDAIGRVELAQRQGEESTGLSAYAVFLYELHAVRYGESKQYSSAAERLSSTLPFDTAETPALKLAAAARALRSGEPDRADGQLRQVLQALPGNEDALQLEGELELSRAGWDKALQAFERLASVEKRSPRALYGIARAQLAKGDTAAAATALDECITGQPNHVGAILEKAALAFDAGQVDSATELISSVEGERAQYASPLDTARALELKAAIHLKAGRLGEALASYREAVKLNDRSVRAHLGMGEIFHERGEEAEALAHFQMASRIDPANLDAVLGAAQSLITMVGSDNLQTARQSLEGALREHPEEARIQFLLGKTLEALSDPDEAQASYEKAIELNKTYLEPYLALADMHLKRSRIDEGMAVLDRARQEMPNDPRIATSVGQGYLERGEYTEAEEQFRLALRADSDHLPALYFLGITMRRMGRLNDARAAFERLARIDPRYPGLIVQQGLVLERTGQPGEALAIYRAELERNPEDLDMKLRVAAALVLVDNCDEAVALLRDVVQERPDSAEALYYQGRCALASGHPDDAERALRRAVENDPQNGDFRAYLGMAYLQTGAIEHAAVELARALELDPTNAVAYWQRGALTLRSGAAPAAARDLERALELSPGLVGVYQPLAQAYDQMRRPADAIRYFELAVHADPEDFLSHYYLAQIITDQRGPSAGLPLYARAVELGRRMDPRPRFFFEALFSQGALLHELHRDAEARDVLAEYVRDAPTTSVDRDEALELLHRLGRGDSISE